MLITKLTRPEDLKHKERLRAELERYKRRSDIDAVLKARIIDRILEHGEVDLEKLSIEVIKEHGIDCENAFRAACVIIEDLCKEGHALGKIEKG